MCVTNYANQIRVHFVFLRCVFEQTAINYDYRKRQRTERRERERESLMLRSSVDKQTNFILLALKLSANDNGNIYLAFEFVEKLEFFDCRL